MTRVESMYQPSVTELARTGNFRAIAYWLNSHLVPQGIYARVEAARPGCLLIAIEFQRAPERDLLVRLICHRLWQLNSNIIEGAVIIARLAGASEILWKQSVRIITPANRERLRRSQQLNTKLKLGLGRITGKLTPSQLVSGSALAAFLLGSSVSYYQVLAYRSPNSASSLPSPEPSTPAAERSATVQAALETVPAVEQTNILNPDDPSVTLMFGGDVTLADAFTEVVGQDYESVFADMNEYRQADVAMVNFENPATTATEPFPNKQENFKADPATIQVLKDGGVDIVNLANDHVMDYQAPGLLETLKTLDAAEISHVGAGQDVKAARRPEIIDVKGQRIAYLGYYNADLYAAGANTPGTNTLERNQVAEDIHAIRDQVDWVIVNYHWGVDLADEPGDWQVDLAHFTIDQGADLVVGHHPHVLQGAEIYQGRPIAYSLGNFIFGGSNSPSDYDTAVLKVAVKDKQMKVEMLPVEVTNYRPKVATGDRADEILEHFKQVSNIFEQPMASSITLNARTSEVEKSTDTTSDTQSSSSPESSTEPTESPIPEISTEPSLETSTTSTPAPVESPANAEEFSTPETTQLDSEPLDSPNLAESPLPETSTDFPSTSGESSTSSESTTSGESTVPENRELAPAPTSFTEPTEYSTPAPTFEPSPTAQQPLQGDSVPNSAAPSPTPSSFITYPESNGVTNSSQPATPADSFSQPSPTPTAIAPSGYEDSSSQFNSTSPAGSLTP